MGWEGVLSEPSSSPIPGWQYRRGEGLQVGKKQAEGYKGEEVPGGLRRWRAGLIRRDLGIDPKVSREQSVRAVDASATGGRGPGNRMDLQGDGTEPERPQTTADPCRCRPCYTRQGATIPARWMDGGSPGPSRGWQATRVRAVRSARQRCHLDGCSLGAITNPVMSEGGQEKVASTHRRHVDGPVVSWNKRSGCNSIKSRSGLLQSYFKSRGTRVCLRLAVIHHTGPGEDKLMDQRRRAPRNWRGLVLDRREHPCT